MLCIQDTSTDPCFNIAAETYVMRNFVEECFMLWRNGPSIIVGKHQNTLAEINIDYVKKHKIKVVRRLSGGGAVFHDLGNLNFTFIRNGEEGKLVDFKKFTLPIIEALRELGVNARFEGRNDLTIEGRKFSGNAEHVFKKRVLHHGTLLFSSKLPDLSQALKVNPMKFQDKAVKSVRSRVTNIHDHLPKKMSVTEFQEYLMQYMMKRYPDSRIYEYSGEDIRAIEKLGEEKFSTWDWNFGYSPDYNFKRAVRSNGGHIEFHMDVQKGVIRKLKIFGDYFHSRETGEFEALLIDCPHEELAIRERLSSANIHDYFKNATLDEVIKGMF